MTRNIGVPDRIFSVVRLVPSEKGMVAELWHTAFQQLCHALPTLPTYEPTLPLLEWLERATPRVLNNNSPLLLAPPI
jgi:hypothetical protein